MTRLIFEKKIPHKPHMYNQLKGQRRKTKEYFICFMTSMEYTRMLMVNSYYYGDQVEKDTKLFDKI